MDRSTPSLELDDAIARSLAQINSGDAAEMRLRQNHPRARYRGPHPVFDLTCSLLRAALNAGATSLQLRPAREKNWRLF